MTYLPIADLRTRLREEHLATAPGPATTTLPLSQAQALIAEIDRLRYLLGLARRLARHGGPDLGPLLLTLTAGPYDDERPTGDVADLAKLAAALRSSGPVHLRLGEEVVELPEPACQAVAHALDIMIDGGTPVLVPTPPAPEADP